MTNNKLVNFIKDWVIPVLIAVLLTILIRKFLFFNIQVPTGSMIPTIEINDRLLVTKVYNTNHLKRGQVVVFTSKELNNTLIKRLIGLPGDTVTIKHNGDVYVNDKKIDQSYVVHPGGIPMDSTSEEDISYQVPQGQFFFLGDNRANSDDSRYWQNHFIDKKDIMGVARITIFPFSRIGKLK
ncbi:MAG: signal peptidase I [Bacillota bacterium]|nr:signal peptidase I [Bacillota bacterium]